MISTKKMCGIEFQQAPRGENLHTLLPVSARKYSDKKWYKLLLASIENPMVDGIEFPRFPSTATQTTFVGSAQENALREAYAFYVFLKNAAKRVGRPVVPEGRFLDFGCGWGRFLRFAWKDVYESNLFGCDVDQMIVDTSAQTNVPGQIQKIEPVGKLPYENSSFDIAMAYSVFTHLPEIVHLHCMSELARVIRPGGILIVTLEPRRFMDFIARSNSDNEWHRALAAHIPNLAEYYRQFDNGNFVFMPTNKGAEKYYGDAVVPIRWVKENWSPFFDVRSYLDDAGQFWQAVLVAQRTNVPMQI